MYALTAKMDSQKDLDQLAGSIRAGYSELAGKAQQLTRRMNRLQLVEKKFWQADSHPLQNARAFP